MEDDRHGEGALHRVQRLTFLTGLLSMAWFLLRTGGKPSRASYPCQIVARANSEVWLFTYVIPLVTFLPWKTYAILSGKRAALIASVLIVASAVVTLGWWYLGAPSQEPQIMDETDVGAALTGMSASLSPASDIFVVSGTTGDDGGVDRLIDTMGRHGLPFYESPSTGVNKGRDGLIAADDVVLIKVNGQWDERGGTNTDLVKALIQAVLDHPDVFTGEIVVADNGQAQYGSTGRGGSLDYARNNAEDTSQSVQGVVDSFSGSHRVSDYLWDTITTNRVGEYSEGDVEDGYVVNTTANPRTGIMVSYPKFKTGYGTHISFKEGIWNPESSSYDDGRLKVINIPVLKTHGGYGVTACVKHYMGVPSDKLTAGLGSRTHNTIGRGGMGTLIAETRYPVLNILDAIWVNANPRSGPSTPYRRATRVNVVAASTDPVALDHWAAKHILLEAAPEGADKTTVDPDNDEPGVFGRWLRLSLQEIVRAGFQATVDEDRMNVYISR
jgi:hypothetical protein